MTSSLMVQDCTWVCTRSQCFRIMASSWLENQRVVETIFLYSSQAWTIALGSVQERLLQMLGGYHIAEENMTVPCLAPSMSVNKTAWVYLFEIPGLCCPVAR